MNSVALVARAIAAAALALCLASVAARAGEFNPAPYEVWAGTYECGPIARDPERWPGYSARVRLVLDNGTAKLVKESARIRETMAGEVGADGRLTLEGTGMFKAGGPRWRYRFEGRFEGAAFEASGEMLSANLSEKLRECGMSLARVHAAAAPPARLRAESTLQESPARPQAAGPKEAPAPIERARARAPAAVEKAEQRASAAMARLESAAPAVSVQAAPAQAPSQIEQPAAAQSVRNAPPAPDASASVEKAIDFTRGHDAAVVEGTVARGRPDRYALAAKRGQTLTATLHADGGARLEVYEPGAIVSERSDGFMVQGARVKGAADGARVSAELPDDGKYLLLVRALRDQARYTLEVAVGGAAPMGGKVLEHAGSERQAASAGEQHALVAWLALALGLAVTGAGIFARRKRDVFSRKARHAPTALVFSGFAICAVALYFLLESKPPAADTAQPLAAAPRAEPEAAASVKASALQGGTYVCGAAKAGETSLVSTFKYFPDGTYIELARTMTDRVPTMTAVRIGTYELGADSTLTLRQVAASPNIEFGEPFVKTDLLLERQVSGDLRKGYDARVTKRVTAGQAQAVLDTTQRCVRDDAAGAKMDQLREELKAHLPAR